MPQRIDGIALGSIAAGSVLLYAGITGKSIPQALQLIISGKSPAGAQQKYGIQQVTQQAAPNIGVPGGVASLGTGNPSALVSLATQGAGHCYKYGGAPGLDGRGCWDCSSFMNWVIGHQAGLAIPGFGAGKYDGSQHGPPTGFWLLWSGCTHISLSQVNPGDLVVSSGHMGMFTDAGGNYISAHDPASGTSVTGFSSNGFPDTPPGPWYLHLKALDQTGVVPTPSGRPAPRIGVL